MARANIPLLAFNRGLISPKALGRVDLDRNALSASIMTNWLPKTQGAMAMRPGTEHFGNSLNDTGAEFVEFVAATDDVALLELTTDKMRIWLGSDSHALALLERPAIATTVALTDTGWSNASTGGTLAVSSGDIIPVMTSGTTGGVTISANHSVGGEVGWKVGDDKINTVWRDTTTEGGELPAILQVDFGSNNAKNLSSYTVRATDQSGDLDKSPTTWALEARDTGAWVTEDTQSGLPDWSVAEKRTFLLTDTGTADAWRFWRLNISGTQNTGVKKVVVSEVEMLPVAVSTQALFSAGNLTLNSIAVGSLAKAVKQVVVDTGDADVEHSLAINVTRGPVIFRVGSTAGNDDYIADTSLCTGFHNLAFTPSANFHITIQSDAIVDRTIGSLTIGDTGTVVLTTPWGANNISNVRYTQSADVVFADCQSIRPQKIERRGTGRSWSVVDFTPNNGPFQSFASTIAKLSVSGLSGNTTMSSDIPFFKTSHTGGLINVFHDGQSSVTNLGALNATTKAFKVTGITDTGTAGPNRERRVTVDVTGTYQGTVTVQKSFDGEDFGFHDTDFADTGGATHTFDDPDDNSDIFYRAKLTAHSAGVAVVTITYTGGGTTGVARITAFNSNTNVDIEILTPFSSTDPSDNWQEGSWSTLKGFPSAVALHSGRLAHAGQANMFLSVSDDFENFDIETIGDAGPIIRTLGSGPVDNIFYLLSLPRLVVGTTGAELALRSSSLDEVLTPTNNSVRAFSTQGSGNIRAIPLNSKGIFVQRSGQRLFQIGPADNGLSLDSLESQELTLLVPDLMVQGIVSIAIQRQPDTRIHCVLDDGTVAILTYEPQEEVLAWSKWVSDSGAVERVAILPGTEEDAVYYHVNRTINGATKRFLEKWAKETEAQGDTGLSFLADCSKSFTDTGRATSLTGFGHLEGSNVVVWGDDTGQSTPGKDYSPDEAGVQKVYAVSSGAITLDTGLGLASAHHAVAGLGFKADYQSTKLAYAAEAGTALAQLKRTDKIGFVLFNTHNNGLFFGSDTGNLDPLPRDSDEGATVDKDKIFAEFDKASMPFNGLWDADSRIYLQGRSPRPVTVMAMVPTVQTNEKV